MTRHDTMAVPCDHCGGTGTARGYVCGSCLGNGTRYATQAWVAGAKAPQSRPETARKSFSLATDSRTHPLTPLSDAT